MGLFNAIKYAIIAGVALLILGLFFVTTVKSPSPEVTAAIVIGFTFIGLYIGWDYGMKKDK